MAKIITITGASGGTGKSTLTANLATSLSGPFGQRVLCVDLDNTNSLALWFQLAAPVTEADFTPAALQAARSRSVRPAQLSGGLHGQQELQTHLRAVTPTLDVITEWRGKEAFAAASLAGVQAAYDYILIDTSHHLLGAVERACGLADLVLIAGGLSVFEPYHLRSLVAELAQAGGQRWFPQQLRSVLSYRVERGAEELSAAEAARQRAYYVTAYSQPGLPPLCQTGIRADEEYEESLCECRPVLQYRPTSKTGQNYLDLTAELLAVGGDEGRQPPRAA